jgi:hypothetical protein
MVNFLTASDMSHTRRTEDPAQTDRAWAGYHPRAAAPAVATAALASLVVWTGRGYFDPLSELTARAGALAVFALAWGVWPALAAVYLYRTVTYSYRLTDRALWTDYGFWWLPVPPLWLAEVTAVRAGAGWLGRRLGVGWVEVVAGARAVRLVGVRDPQVFAEQVRAATAAVRFVT